MTRPAAQPQSRGQWGYTPCPSRPRPRPMSPSKVKKIQLRSELNVLIRENVTCPTWSLKVCCSPSKRLEFSRYFHIIDLWSNFVIIQNILHDFNSFVLREVCFLAQNMVQRSTCLWKRRVICRRRTDEVGRHCFYGPISRLLAETPREGGRSPRPHRGSLCFSFPV